MSVLILLSQKPYYLKNLVLPVLIPDRHHQKASHRMSSAVMPPCLAPKLPSKEKDCHRRSSNRNTWMQHSLPPGAMITGNGNNPPPFSVFVSCTPKDTQPQQSPTGKE